MTTRDLTKEFIQIRSRSSKSNMGAGAGYDGGNSRNSLLKNGGDAAAAWEDARDSLPPLWVEKVEDVNDCIAKIQKHMEELGKLHSDRLRVKFDGSEEDADQKIDMLTPAITRIFREAESKLKAVSSQQQRALTAAEVKVRKNVQRSMALQLQQLSQDFRKSQKKYLSRLEQQKTNSPGFEDFPGEQDSGFTDEQMMEMETHVEDIDSRDQEIQKIAQSIEELSTIFKELAVHVIDQGTMLDRIDYNMEMVVERTKEGNKELTIAEKHQKSSRPLKCMAFLVFMIIIMIIILVFKLKKK